MNRVQIREKQTRKNPVLRKCFFKSNDIVEQRAEMLMFLVPLLFTLKILATKYGALPTTLLLSSVLLF